MYVCVCVCVCVYKSSIIDISGKWISQTLTTGLVVIFRFLFKEELLQTLSFNKELNIENKTVESVWFIHFSTYFYHLVGFTKTYHFSLPPLPPLSLSIYIYNFLL